MRVARFVCVLIAALAASSANCRPPQDDGGRPAQPGASILQTPNEVDLLEDDVLAVVGGEIFPAEPVRSAVRRWAAVQPEAPASSQVRERRRSIADALVVMLLVHREAVARGVTINSAVAVAELAQSAGGERAVRARTGETDEELTARLETEVLLSKLTSEPTVRVDVRAWRRVHPEARGSDSALEATLVRAELVRRRGVLVAELRERYAVREPLRDAMRATDARARARAADPFGAHRASLSHLGPSP